MKNILKVVLCLGCFFTVSACGSKEEKSKEVEPVEEKNVTKESSEYFKGYEEDYELSASNYKIKLPIDYKYTNNSLRSDSIKMTTKDGRKLGALITTTEVYEELDPNFTITDIREKFKNDRSSNLSLIYSGEAETVYNDQFEETTVGDKKALLDKGVASDSGGEVGKYAVYHFFLDDENKIPCEFLLMSEEIEPDELAKIAAEMIGMISEKD